MKVKSLIDDKKKMRVRDAIAKNDHSVFGKKKTTIGPEKPDPAKEQMSPERKRNLDAELITWLSLSRPHDMIATLLRNGANPNARNSEGETALMVAVKTYENQLGITILVPKGDSAENIRRRIHDSGLKFLKLLFESGADVNATDKDGRTAWDHARDSRERIRGLFESYGATINAGDKP